MAIKLLIGGSPCTYWSIAQKNNRETEASGVGWELFKNYLIAKEKFKPDFFLYENNKSASQAIKEQVARELGVGVDPSVRFTYINSNLVSAQNRERFYVTNFGDIEQPRNRNITLGDVLGGVTDRDKSRTVISSIGRTTTREYFKKRQGTMAFEPVSKVSAKYLLKNLSMLEDKSHVVTASCYKGIGSDGTTTIAERVEENETTGIYATPVEFENGVPTKAISYSDGKTYSVYEVKNSLITIKGEQYPVKLTDGFYIIRKLTVVECARLQTMPVDYYKAVSDTQAYKAIGNGWTAEVIIHLLNHALKDVPRDTEIIVLSLYDGVATGRYCLEEMGFTNIKYHAYEIDKYPISVAVDNYPDIIHHGDAFAVREDTWKPPQSRSDWLDELLGGDL